MRVGGRGDRRELIGLELLRGAVRDIVGSMHCLRERRVCVGFEESDDHEREGRRHVRTAQRRAAETPASHMAGSEIPLG